MSTPQPERPWLAKGLVYAVPKFGAILLLLVSIEVFFAVLQAIFTNQQLSGQAIATVLVLALAWFLYLKVADGLAAVRRLGRLGRGHKHGSGGHGGGHGD